MKTPVQIARSDSPTGTAIRGTKEWIGRRVDDALLELGAGSPDVHDLRYARLLVEEAWAAFLVEGTDPKREIELGLWHGSAAKQALEEYTRRLKTCEAERPAEASCSP